MSKRKTNQYEVVMYTTKSIIEMPKQAKALLLFVTYRCKQMQGAYRAYLIGSEHNPRYAVKCADYTGKRGRPKKYFWEAGKLAKSNPHYHMLIKCNPSDTLLKEIKKYWQKRNGEDTFYYRKANSGVIGYLGEQATFERSSEYDPQNAIKDWD